MLKSKSKGITYQSQKREKSLHFSTIQLLRPLKDPANSYSASLLSSSSSIYLHSAFLFSSSLLLHINLSYAIFTFLPTSFYLFTYSQTVFQSNLLVPALRSQQQALAARSVFWNRTESGFPLRSGSLVMNQGLYYLNVCFRDQESDHQNSRMVMSLNCQMLLWLILYFRLSRYERVFSAAPYSFITVTNTFFTYTVFSKDYMQILSSFPLSFSLNSITFSNPGNDLIVTTSPLTCNTHSLFGQLNINNLGFYCFLSSRNLMILYFLKGLDY